jgi:RNA polymerase sigma-70 factor, ECF subfamily
MDMKVLGVSQESAPSSGTPAGALAAETPVLDVEALFRAHASFVAGFLVRLGALSDEIDDLVQEVFLTAHRRGGYVPGPAKPTTWLAEIAMRVVLSNKRSRRRRRVEPDEDAVEAAVDDTASPFDSAAATEAVASVQRALDALDIERRAVFVLFELEGESCAAIAGCLGIPIGTVYSRLHTARAEFQRAYERQNRGTRPLHTAQGGAS